MSWWDGKGEHNKYSETYEPQRFKVLELPSGKHIDPEGIKAIPQLAHNPAFLALCAKMQLQKAALEHQLKTKHFADIREVDKIQNGIYWCNWLESTMRSEVFRQETAAKKPRDAYEVEQKEFNRMFETLSIVGKE